MKAFDPIAAGMRGGPGVFSSRDTLIDGTPRLVIYREINGVLLVSIAKTAGAYTVAFTIPALFDHDTVVALLRANGADIPEASDGD